MRTKTTTTTTTAVTTPPLIQFLLLIFDQSLLQWRCVFSKKSNEWNVQAIYYCLFMHCLFSFSLFFFFNYWSYYVCLSLFIHFSFFSFLFIMAYVCYSFSKNLYSPYLYRFLANASLCNLVVLYPFICLLNVIYIKHIRLEEPKSQRADRFSSNH